MKQAKPSTSYGQIVGQVVRCHRILLGISLAKMSKNLELSSSGLSRIETGNTTMSIIQLREIAKRLNMSSADILYQADELVTQLEGNGIAIYDSKPKGNNYAF